MRWILLGFLSLLLIMSFFWQVQWKRGTPVPYLHMARVFHRVENETGIGLFVWWWVAGLLMRCLVALVGRIKIGNYLTYMLWKIISLTPQDTVRLSLFFSEATTLL